MEIKQSVVKVLMGTLVLVMGCQKSENSGEIQGPSSFRGVTKSEFVKEPGGKFAYVGAITYFGAEGYGAGICTASLLCGNVIVTAQHCAKAAKDTVAYFCLHPNVQPVLFDRIGDGQSLAETQCARIVSWKTSPHAKFANSDSATGIFYSDVALGALDKKANLEFSDLIKKYPQISQNQDRRLRRDGIAVSLVGYGSSKDKKTAFKAGLKQLGTSTIQLKYNMLSFNKAHRMLLLEPTQSVVEPGDSGGPSVEVSGGNHILHGVASGYYRTLFGGKYRWIEAPLQPLADWIGKSSRAMGCGR